MPDTISQLQSSTIDSAAGAFDAFCDDISGMFGISVEGTASDQQLVTLKELKSDFKKLTAVFIAEGKGSVNGTFYIILDQDALFTLSGTFVMLPEKIIIQNRKMGKEKEANEMADAVGEVGNLLIGAWDKFFRGEMENHEHFLQNGTFIGKPWLKPEENIGLDKDAEMVAVKYEMSVDSFDPFFCMAAFPKSVFDVPREKKEQQLEKEKEADSSQKSEETNQSSPGNQTSSEPVEENTTEPPKEQQPTDIPEKETETGAKEKSATEKTETEDQNRQTDSLPDETLPENETAEESPGDNPDQNRPISKIIEQMTQSHAVLPGQITSDFLTEIKSINVMRSDLAWASQDDTVENVMAKMQQQNTGYALIGTPNEIQGIVSKSDIQGALSPYLQAIFSKWKRELDTATLQIKVRWIMSRPVHTVRPDASLAVILETMCKHSVRALPVADENGVCGLITVYTIFNALNAAAEDTEQTDQQGLNTDVPALN